jgi:hypothetical protein
MRAFVIMCSGSFFHAKHFFIEHLEISTSAFIFSLCNSEDLYNTLFGRDICAKIRDEFRDEISKLGNKVRL